MPRSGQVIFEGTTTSGKYWRGYAIIAERNFASTTEQENLCKMFVTYVYCDSRGARLHQKLRDLSDFNTAFRVRFKRGATLKQLWELIEYDLLTKRIDLVVIFCGICDLTDRCYSTRGRRLFLPPFNMDERFQEVENTMAAIGSNFSLLNQGNKLCFLPEPGCDLIRMNGIHHPVPWKALVVQSSFEHNLEILQLKSEKINQQLGVPTPWTLEISHNLRHDSWVPVYDRFLDGIHPTDKQATEYSIAIARYVRSALRV